MKKLYFFLGALAFSVFVGCDDSHDNERFFNETLKRIVLDSKADSVSINIKELVKFDWDYFIMIPPYTNIDRLEDSINVNLEKVNDTRIQYNDYFVVLAFIKNHMLVDCFVAKYFPFDFSVLKPFMPYLNDESHFLFVRNGNKYIPLLSRSQP